MAVKGPGVNAKNGLFQVKKVGCVWRVMPRVVGVASQYVQFPEILRASNVDWSSFSPFL